MSELKPCPFCGGNDVCRLIDYEDAYERKYCEAVHCRTCKVRTPWMESYKDAIDFWNKRYKEDEQ